MGLAADARLPVVDVAVLGSDQVDPATRAALRTLWDRAFGDRFDDHDAEHAFVNEQRQSVHDRQAAELAWGRATEFFKKHLG